MGKIILFKKIALDPLLSTYGVIFVYKLNPQFLQPEKKHLCPLSAKKLDGILSIEPRKTFN
jgi:hypothetical protein